MPSFDDDEKPRRRRRKQYDREQDSNTSKDKERSDRRREKASSSTSLNVHKRRSGSKERDRGRDSPRSATSERDSRKTSLVPEMERRTSGEARPAASYPAFSKVHSREAVGSREDISKPASPFTPEPADAPQDKAARRNSTPAHGTRSVPPRGSPSPPSMAEDPSASRSGSGGSVRRSEELRSDAEDGRKSADNASRTTGPAKASKSQTSLRKEARFSESDVSSMPGAFPEDLRRSTPDSYRRTISTSSQPASTLTQDTAGTGTDSDATSIAPERKEERKEERKARINRTVEIIDVNDNSPESVTDSQPRTPTEEQKYPLPMRTKTPIIDVGTANAYTPGSQSNLSLDPKTPMTAVPPPPPPPPPPPLVTGAQGAPRVDYLLKHGGLQTMIPKRLINGNGTGPGVQQYAMYQSPAIGQIAQPEEYAKIFNPLHKRLDDYLHVLRHHGSLAVATGYKSVARRLLDKLSQVFARDISSQKCDCVICKTTPQPTLSDEEDSGVSWGEILEFVAGRRELPQWPPFTIAPESANLGLGLMNTMGVMKTGSGIPKPMQKLDVDVPEEYRDHYIRQNQKTKKAVQNWLSHQPDLPSSPPDEADEDTLMFAMMTKLDASQRNVFIALMHGQSSIPMSRAPTPAERPQQASDALKRTRKALQRLYRLERPPRDSESAIYLLNNAHLHGMLATLAEVNEAEWEILVSGRFDGFLWSGAEAPFPPSASQYGSPVASRAPSRAQNQTPFSRNTTPFSGMSGFQPSRGPTPFSPLRNMMSPDNSFGQHNLQPQAPPMFPSRGPTPAFNGMGVSPPAPVQLDEETEIAVLAEVERNLFNDMERFEDAFEVLHSRAEHVRQLLRERSAGLSMQAQLRRGSNGDSVHVRLDTPASGITDFESEGEGDDDDGLADLASLAPDDSASQISVNRRFRKRERQGKRTPAPAVVAEEDESFIQDVPMQQHGHHYHQQHGALPPPPPLPRQTSGRRSKY